MNNARQVRRAVARRNAFREISDRFSGPRKIRRQLSRDIGNFVYRNQLLARSVSFDELLDALLRPRG